jgi:hypothetical protein
MAQWFDEITKTLADDKLSRRQVAKRIAGTVAGVALASIIPAEALAKKKKPRCPKSDNLGKAVCPPTFASCGGNSNCYQFVDISQKIAWCGCNEYCSTAKPCSKDANCAKGYYCGGCGLCGASTGLCLQCCNKTCTLSSSHAGRTLIG